VSESNSATHQYLLDHYGPLLTLKHLAEVMHSTPSGLRMALTRGQQPYARALAQARRRLGRRVYFEARRVAECIDCDAQEEDWESPARVAMGKQMNWRL
jgi:hypothetical protein